MADLSKNWLTDKYIDFEYKKYILLAWLQEVNSHFHAQKLYPFLAQLIDHYRELIHLRSNRSVFLSKLPKQLKGIDLKNLELEFETHFNGEQDLLQELEEILHYSIEQMEAVLKRGKSIYEEIESHLKLESVGIQPLQNNFGYLMLGQTKSRETRVYEYQVTIFQNPQDNYRGLSTQFKASYFQSITNTPERIKEDLIKKQTFFTPPATYLIEADLDIPFEETFFPIARRMMMRKLAI